MSLEMVNSLNSAKTYICTVFCLLLVLLNIAGVPAAAVAEESSDGHHLGIEVIGLFKDAVLIRVDGDEQLIKVNQTSRHGVTLVEADSKGAVIEYNGAQTRLGLSDRISSNFVQPETRSVSIVLNAKNRYEIGGYINGKSVKFVVDTGATVVALNSSIAAKLGISTRGALRHQVSTASGRARASRVTLKSVSVGGIEVKNVQAVVVDGGFPEDILLGMTYLENVDMAESAGILQLTAKF